MIIKYKIDLIYTLFGPGLHHKSLKSVTGCAYSNLFFPEINFWVGYSFFDRIKLWLIDKYRLSSVLRSDAIIFENEAMRKRAISLFRFPESRTKLILPSISKIPLPLSHTGFEQRLNIIDTTCFNVLILSGWHRNKNIEIVPEVLLSLKQQGVFHVKFIITVSPNDYESVNLYENAKRLGVEDGLIFFDSVTPYEVPSLIFRVDAIALFSTLESFSNNIIEAWTYKKALIISNEEWSRAICGESAVYVDRMDERDIASKIKYLVDNPGYLEELILSYEDVLKHYPSPREKVVLQIEYLKEIYNDSVS